MTAPTFIAGKLSFKGKAAATSVAVSFFVIIVALAVSMGFRSEIRRELAQIGGEARISSYNLNLNSADDPLFFDEHLIDEIREIDGVKTISPVIYRVGVVKNAGDVHGVIFKGVESADSASLKVSIPRKLARVMRLEQGSKMPTWFISDRTVIRNFEVGDIYDGIVTADDKLVVTCDIRTLRRVNGWSEEDGGVSALEVNFTTKDTDLVCNIIAETLYTHSDEDSPALSCTRMENLYPDLFSWLDLIDNNVLFILIIMMVVAGINMISGLLILLFENIRTIGLLKSLGMSTGGIARTFLLSGGSLVARGMLWGNVAAIVLCLIQKFTHLLTLNPENYFISFVPVELSIGGILMCDVVAFAVIMLVMLLPCTFISKVDPARTMSSL